MLYNTTCIRKSNSLVPCNGLQTFGGFQHVRLVQLDVGGVQRGYEEAHKEEGYTDFEEHNELGSFASSRDAPHGALQHQLNAFEQQAEQQPKSAERRELFAKLDHMEQKGEHKQ